MRQLRTPPPAERPGACLPGTPLLPPPRRLLAGHSRPAFASAVFTLCLRARMPAVPVTVGSDFQSPVQALAAGLRTSRKQTSPTAPGRYK